MKTSEISKKFPELKLSRQALFATVKNAKPMSEQKIPMRIVSGVIVAIL